MSHKTVFLDRDGTIARDVHYCRRAEDLELLPTVPEAVRLLNTRGFKVIIVTNQSGIARGYFDAATLAGIHRKMLSDLEKSKARIDAIYYCPHHPDEGCLCRKPGTALFQQAAREHNVSLPDSFVVGDARVDIDAGRALGCRTVLVTTGSSDSNEVVNGADFVASSLLAAAQWITGR